MSHAGWSRLSRPGPTTRHDFASVTALCGQAARGLRSRTDSTPRQLAKLVGTSSARQTSWVPIGWANAPSLRALPCLWIGAVRCFADAGSVPAHSLCSPWDACGRGLEGRAFLGARGASNLPARPSEGWNHGNIDSLAPPEQCDCNCFFSSRTFLILASVCFAATRPS